MARKSASSFTTDAQVRNTHGPAPGQDRREYRDTVVKGLVLRVTHDFTRTWLVWVKDPRDGKWKKITLGRYDEDAPDHISLAEARKLAWERKLAANPFAKPTTQLRVKDVCKLYIDRYAKPRKRSWQEDERRLNKHLIPQLGDFYADKVERSHLADRVHEIAHTAPIEANRVLDTIKNVFDFAVEQGRLDASPATLVRRPSKEKSRSRVLTDDEVRILWLATNHPPFTDVTRDALRLLLLLGARLNEVLRSVPAEMELHGELPLWRLPGLRTKMGVEVVRPLPPLALSIFKARLSTIEGRKHKNPFLFTAQKSWRTTQRYDQPITKTSIWLALKRANDHPDLQRPGHFTPHDLRRTTRTGLAQLGVSSEVSKKILGHGPSRSDVDASVYNRHHYLPEMYAALSKWESHILSIVGRAS